MSAELRKSEFQTPPQLAKFMVDLVPASAITILAPPPGEGNIVKAFGPFVNITAPTDLFEMEKQRFDCVVMNPPFSIEYTYGVPDHLNKRGSQVGYHILKGCMEMSDNIIALLPWFILTNSEKRTKQIKAWGLKSVVIVPRRWFPGSRSSNCILVLEKGYTGTIELTTFEA